MKAINNDIRTASSSYINDWWHLKAGCCHARTYIHTRARAHIHSQIHTHTSTQTHVHNTRTRIPHSNANQSASTCVVRKFRERDSVWDRLLLRMLQAYNSCPGYSNIDLYNYVSKDQCSYSAKQLTKSEEACL